MSSIPPLEADLSSEEARHAALIKRLKGLERRIREGRRDPYRKLAAWSQAGAAIAIPVVLAIVGHWVSLSLKSQDVELEKFALAIDVLKQTPTPEGAQLREWATRIVFGTEPVNELVRDAVAARALGVVSKGFVTLPQFDGPESVLAAEETLRRVFGQRNKESVFVVGSDDAAVRALERCQKLARPWNTVVHVPDVRVLSDARRDSIAPAGSVITVFSSNGEVVARLEANEARSAINIRQAMNEAAIVP